MSQKLAKQLDKYLQEIELFKREFARDGVITDEERRILASVSKKIEAVREKMMQGSIVGEGTMPAENISVEMAPFDDARFKRQFHQSVKDWAQDAQIALNRVKTYFIEEKKPDGLKVEHLLKVVSLAMTKASPAAQAFATTVSTVVELAVEAYRQSLPSTPSLNDLQSEWSNALGRYGNASHDKEYADFVRDWKRRHNDPDKVPVDAFLKVCQEFGKGLPKQNAIEKAFLGEVLKHVEDSFDWGDESGVAEITLMCLAKIFSSPGGQLDDVSPQLMQAIKTVWKNERAYQLPVPMKFTIENNMGATLAEIERKSKKPGNTSFKLTDGDKEIFDAFVRKKAYAIPKVSDLSADT